MSAEFAVTTVVFDLGGVVLDWDPRYLYRTLLADEESVETFLREVDFAAWNHQQDAGRAWAEAVEVHSRRHPRHAELLALYPGRFLETVRGEVPGTPDLLHELRRRRVRLLALTNWSAETFPLARARFASWLDLFEDILVSGVEGVAKPDPAIFRLLVERFSLEPAETLFVDDSSVNVAAAADAGMQTALFRGAAGLRADLVRFGLLSEEPSARP